ncbi:MAG: hypothetical protein PPP55_10245 [Halorubrum sp.]
MTRKIRLNRIETVLSTLTYPVTPAEVERDCGDVLIQLADGEVTLGETVAMSSATRLASVDELRTELLSLLPRRAVGEPFQSDGDA